MKSLYYLILIVVLFNNQIFSQINYGIIVGGGSNKLIMKKDYLLYDYVSTYSNSACYHVGMCMKQNFSKNNFGYGVEILFNYKSVDYHYPDYYGPQYIGPAFDRKDENQYLHIPVFISYRIITKIQINAGIINSMQFNEQGINSDIKEYKYNTLGLLKASTNIIKNTELGLKYTRSMGPMGELDKSVDLFVPEKGITFYYQTFELYFCYNLNQFFKKD